MPGITERALITHDPSGSRAAGTIAARHAGIVLGILLLTPIFNSQLTEQHRAAERSGTALLLDAPLPPKTKIELARAIGDEIKRADGQLPDLSPAFRAVESPADARPELGRLETDLEEEVDKAATHAFSESFLLAGCSPCCPWSRSDSGGVVDAAGWTHSMRLSFGTAVLAGSIVVSVGLIVIYLVLGGASYAPAGVADPCKPRPIEKPEGGGEVLQQVALSALDGAACELDVSREELTLALADRNSRERFLRDHRVTDQVFEQALRAGLVRAVDDARRVDALSELEASLIRAALERLPIGVVIDVSSEHPAAAARPPRRPARSRRVGAIDSKRAATEAAHALLGGERDHHPRRRDRLGRRKGRLGSGPDRGGSAVRSLEHDRQADYQAPDAPVRVITLGIAWFFVAALMLLLTDWLVDGFEIEGFGTLILRDDPGLGRQPRARLPARPVARHAARLTR